MRIPDGEGFISHAEALVCNGETNNNSSAKQIGDIIEGDYIINIKSEPTEEGFALEAGSKLLARWYDGLFHPARLLQLKHEECGLVEFDDLSQHWVGVYDLQWPPQESDTEIKCSLCHLEHSNRPNQIVLCDGCGFGFHQQCHHPILQKQVVKSNDDWYCVLCQFSLPEKNRPSTRKIQKPKTVTKKVLPYNAKTLHWTQSHCSNVEQCYCYCGGSGQWYLKMLQCTRCKQWFHEACLSVRPAMPLTCGDTSYLFICSLCNDGPELLHRIDLRWVDIAHIALFNLAISKGKWSDFDLDIMPWINSRWDSLNVGVTLSDTPLAERFLNILHALRQNPDTFKNSSDVKKSAALYALRVRAAPLVPLLPSLPSDKSVKPSAIKQLQNSITYPAPSTHTVSVSYYGKRSKKRKCSFSSEESEQQQPKRKKKKLSPSNDGPGIWQIIPGDPIVPKIIVDFEDSSKNSNEESSPIIKEEFSPRPKKKVKRRMTLDKKIPFLSDFTSMNHPFLTIAETNILADKHRQIEAKRKSRQQMFDTFVKGLPGSDIMCDITNSPKSSCLSLLNDNRSNIATRSRDHNSPKAKQGRSKDGKSKAKEEVKKSMPLRRNSSVTGELSGAFTVLKTRSNKTDEVSNPLERCIYVGDALEHDEFQIRAARKEAMCGKHEYLVEWYEDMGIGGDTNDNMSDMSV